MTKVPIHAHDSKGDLFEGFFPVLYSVEGWTKGYYFRQSQQSSLLAEVVSGGLRGKDVLDIGCGYGTTTLAISRFFPASITSIDGSRAMTAMMNFLVFSDEAVEQWLIERGAREVLGRRFERTAEYLKLFRRCFRRSSFDVDTALRVVSSPLMSFSSNALFDAAVANNVLHWSINQLKRELESSRGEKVETDECSAQVFAKVRNYLKPGGILVVMEPRELTTLDSDPSRAEVYDRFCTNANPVFIKLNLILNRILIERYSIDRDMPRNLEMFRVSRMSDLAVQAGFELERVVVIEEPSLARSIDFYPTIIPINLATVDLPLEEKARVIREAETELVESLTDEEKELPIQDQGFYFVFRAV